MAPDPVREEENYSDQIRERVERSIHVSFGGGSFVVDYGEYFGDNPRVREHVEFLRKIHPEGFEKAK